jgi:hypothetical protein
MEQLILRTGRGGMEAYLQSELYKLNHTHMNIEQIAQVAHELNKAYCASIGDNSQPEWADAPQWQKDSAIMGVQFHIHNPDAGPDASHNSWLAQKAAEGWAYGPVKDPENKLHPCFVACADLPTEQKAKDYIFRQTVHSLKSQLAEVNHPDPSANIALTKGQEVMAVSFNPGQRVDVAEIKQSFADAYDTIERHVSERVGGPMMLDATVAGNIQRLAAIAKTNLETAQMYAVKAVTR